MSRASEHAAAVARILQNQAGAKANAQLASGQVWGNAFATIGDIAGNLPMQILQARQQDRQAKEEQQLRELFSSDKVPTASEIFRLVGPERGSRIVTGMAALQTDVTGDFDKQQKVLANVMIGMHSLPESVRAEAYPGVRANLVQRGVIKPEDAPERYDPSWWQTTISYGQQPAASDPAQVDWVETVDAQGRPVKKAVPRVAGTEIVQPPPEVPTMTPYQQESLAIRRAELNKPGGSSGLQLVAVMGPDGKPVLVPEEQAIGMAPASSREQGRPVTSGDANRISELTTSLDDLKVLRTALTETQTSTGAAAALGAMLPNAVTELTGWGQDAKARQGVIDRVKQVIGKALEGGVLRKEDEAKYARILPTISDTPQVAMSKLQGLEAALIQRRSQLLEDLADAGYETGRFQERIGAPTPAPAPVAAPSPRRANPFR